MKLIVMDLDGTLLNSMKMVSFESRNYLMNLRKEGYIIAIATGRTLKSALLATNGADFAQCIICSSGAVVFDNLNKKILKSSAISSSDAKDIIGLYDKDTSYISVNDLEYYNKYGEDIEIENYVSKKIIDVNQFLKDKNDIYHMCIKFKNDKNAEKVSKYILNNFNELTAYTVSCHYAGDKNVDINKKGITKYSAIKYIANLCSINNDDIIAFGDSENDLHMIKNSGVGVAMLNALDEVKDSANYITKTNDENGVIEFLKLYLQ